MGVAASAVRPPNDQKMAPTSDFFPFPIVITLLFFLRLRDVILPVLVASYPQEDAFKQRYMKHLVVYCALV